MIDFKYRYTVFGINLVEDRIYCIQRICSLTGVVGKIALLVFIDLKDGEGSITISKNFDEV